MARNKYPGYCYSYGKCVHCASGRILTTADPGVQWAQRAAAKERGPK